MDGTVYCLDLLSGKELWTFDTQGSISAPATCYRNRILVSSHDASLYCLESRTGSVSWQFEAADEIHASATVVDGFALVIGSCSSVMQAVKVDNGEHFADIRLPGETVAGMAIKGAHVFTATMHGDALCIDWKEGVQVWSKQLNVKRAAQVRGGPLTIGDKFVIGSSDQYVRAIDPNTGDKVWDFRAKGAIASSVSVRDGKIFFTTTRGMIYALDAQNGEELWQHEIGGHQRGGQPHRSGIGLNRWSSFPCYRNTLRACFLPRKLRSPSGLGVSKCNPSWTDREPISGYPVDRPDLSPCDEFVDIFPLGRNNWG